MFFVNDISSTDHQAMREFVSDRLDVLSCKGEKKIIFPHEGRLWNFGGAHKIHKRFLTESTGSTWVGKEQRDNVETVHTHLF
mmetsp:Transcript_89270/g.130570  ORF Transcript_89270/g.130570 Transcript_89270/m.130570 type:complete len:82 (-) Transcript_89270:51-296(-)